MELRVFKMGETVGILATGTATMGITMGMGLAIITETATTEMGLEIITETATTMETALPTATTTTVAMGTTAITMVQATVMDPAMAISELQEMGEVFWGRTRA